MDDVEKGKCVTFVYTNYRSETRIRTVIPISVRFGTSEWHRDWQWLMEAKDIKKGAIREFAMCDIKEWTIGTELKKKKADGEEPWPWNQFTCV